MGDEQDNSILNDIIQYLQDSRNGYKECADVVSSQSLKNLFIMLSNKRNTMLVDLEDAYKDKQVFQSDGTLTGKMHQIFVKIKSFLTSNNVGSIFEEIKRGESILIENYHGVLKHDLAPTMRAVLCTQLIEIQSDLDEVSKESSNYT